MAVIRRDAGELLQGLPGDFQNPKKSALRGLTIVIASEGREFLIAIVGCFSTQESGSLSLSIGQGPLKGNAECFDKDGCRYLL
jgi:hypothetical protein